MGQKKSPTDLSIEELYELLNSQEEIPSTTEEIIEVEPEYVPPKPIQIEAFLENYGLKEGYFAVKGADVFRLYQYKYGKNKEITYNKFILEFKKFVYLDGSSKCFLNKDLTVFFRNRKPHSALLQENNRFNLVKQFYDHFEITQGNELTVSEQEMFDTISVWFLTEITKKFNHQFTKVRPVMRKFFTLKDTKHGCFYVLNSPKLKEFMDEQKEKNKQEK